MRVLSRNASDTRFSHSPAHFASLSGYTQPLGLQTLFLGFLQNEPKHKPVGPLVVPLRFGYWISTVSAHFTSPSGYTSPLRLETQFLGSLQQSILFGTPLALPSTLVASGSTMFSSSPISTICLVKKSPAVHSVSSIYRSKAFNESFWISPDARRDVCWLFRYTSDTEFPLPPARLSSPSGYGWSLMPQTLFLGSPQRGLSNEPRYNLIDALAVLLCALFLALQGDSLISFIYSVCKVSNLGNNNPYRTCWRATSVAFYLSISEWHRLTWVALWLPKST